MSSLVCLYMVLDGLLVSINVMRNFMVSLVRDGGSGNLRCGDVGRNVSCSRMASWQSMGVFN